MVDITLQLRVGCLPVRADNGETWMVATTAVEEFGHLDPPRAAIVADASGGWETLRRAYPDARAAAGLVRGLPDGAGLGPPVAHNLGRLDDADESTVRRLATGSLGDADVGGRLGESLAGGGWLRTTVSHEGTLAYSISPVGSPAPPPGSQPEALVLSRHAVTRRDGGEWLVEAPHAWCAIRLHDPGLMAALATPDRAVDDVHRRLWSDLWLAGLATEAATGDESSDFARRQWAPHEWWFHRRTRTNASHAGPFGPTRWADGEFPPLSARHQPFDEAPITLFRPDLAALRTSDDPLTKVVEARRTVRTHDDAAPITVDQLGEFLFRCARDKWLVERGGAQYLSRPYPAGGSAYELEIYPVVRRVAGLEAGLYHYDAQEHALRPRRGPERPVRRLLRLAANMAGTASQPQVLLVMAARFGRLMWTYEEMAYCLTLKHVGVLQQTMYLVATSMGLAPCALGTGDSDTFAAASGRDPASESSVGEFMLGSLPARPPRSSQ